MLGYGDDLMQQIPSFLRDYWYILIMLIVLVFGSLWMVKKINQKDDDSANWKIWKQTIIYILFIGLFILIGRGGFVSKPIRPTQAAKYTEVSNVQLVLNTAFTVINSWGTVSLEEKNYFTETELNKIYPTVHQFHKKGKYEGQNVVIIIMESMTNEYIGFLNGSGQTYTPFLDELCQKSLVFPNAYANGKKSLDAVPAILASVPKLMNDEYLLSNYSINELNALPELLKEKGYTSTFFHGATNGSMNFDSFCELIKFDQYNGRTEYNNEADYDGTWGIYDEPFLEWTNKEINKHKEPFLDVIFTISNHPPYDIPKQYQDRFKDAPSKKHQAVMYADMALQKFFKSALKEDWAQNTLFVLVADHTPGTDNALYSTDLGKVHIPLLFYHPADTALRGVNNRVMGQIDIMPTILSLVGYDQPFFSFGHAALNDQSGFTSMLIADKYLHIGEVDGEPWMISFQNDELTGLSKVNNSEMQSANIEQNKTVALKLEQQLKAMIQTYNHALLTNSMTVE